MHISLDQGRTESAWMGRFPSAGRVVADILASPALIVNSNNL
jgi:hypothetical protein